MQRAASSGARRAQSGAMAQGGQARLREALQAGGPGSQKEKGPPVADGILTVTPDTPEAVEWRTRRSIIDSAGASSSYLEDESGAGGPARLQRPEQTPKRELALPDGLGSCAGPKPAALYGKFTWKIENFSEISKRELRSTVFEVGSYKWCAPAPRMPARTAAPASLLQCFSCLCACRQVHPGLPAGLRRMQPPVVVPVRGRLRQTAARRASGAPCLQTCPSEVSGAECGALCRLEPLCAVHHCGREQGPEKVQVLWCATAHRCFAAAEPVMCPCWLHTAP